MKVALTDAAFPDLTQEREAAERHGATFVRAASTARDELVRVAENASVLVVQFATIDAAIIDRLAPGARIVRYGVGVDNIDLEAARVRGVGVAYVPDYATSEVADHTATLALTLARRILPFDRSVREGRWSAVEVGGRVRPFETCFVGYIGFGRIGREVHRRLRAFGFEGLVYDPFAEPAALSEEDVAATSLDGIFETADIVTLHAPLTSHSRHVVDAGRLSAMKPSAYLVNTARGGLVDAAALADALSAGTIAGAALDVFEEEPLPAGSSLRQCPNLILTPHASWYSTDAIRRLQALAADEIERQLTGREPRCPVPAAA